MDNNKMRLKELYEINFEETKHRIREAVKVDNMIIQAINNIDELQKSSNLLSKRLREWYSFYFPEIVHKVDDNEYLVDLILSKDRAALFKELQISREDSMGADLKESDIEEIMLLAWHIKAGFGLLKSHKLYIERQLAENCPNMTEVTGAMIGAQLIEHAGSIRNLAKMTASTIQLLGAEKALFRHLRTGAKVPKHGLIIQHPLVAMAKAKDKGKVARAVADKVSIAVRVDYFQGQPIGKQLREILEKRFGKETR